MNTVLAAIAIAMVLGVVGACFGAEPAKPAPTPPATQMEKPVTTEKPRTIEDYIFFKGQLIERSRQTKESAEEAMNSLRDNADRAINDIKVRADKRLAEIKDEMDKIDVEITKLREKK